MFHMLTNFLGSKRNFPSYRQFHLNRSCVYTWMKYTEEFLFLMEFSEAGIELQ